MKKSLILALLFVSFHTVSGQTMQPEHKTKAKDSKYTSSDKPRKPIVLRAYSTQPPAFLTAYAPKPPRFDFGFQTQKNSNSDSSKQVRICGCGSWTAANSPLFLVFSRKKRFKVTSINNIKPNWIKSLSILKDSTTVLSYGQEGKNGVILLTINDKAFPAVYRQLKRQNRTSVDAQDL